MAYDAPIFLRSGASTDAYVRTLKEGAFVRTGDLATAYVRTLEGGIYVRTGDLATAYVRTLDGSMYVRSAGRTDAYVRTGSYLQRLLKLKVEVDALAMDGTSVRLKDSTGIFSGTNAGGYTAENGIASDTRPRRSDLQLYGCARRYNADGSEAFYWLAPQAPTESPWIQDFALPLQDPGVWRFYLIGAPTGVSIANLIGNNLPEYAEQTAGWHVGYVDAFVCPKGMGWLTEATDRLTRQTLSGATGVAAARRGFAEAQAFAEGVAAALALADVVAAAQILEAWDMRSKAYTEE